MRTPSSRRHALRERGQVAVLFALMLPMILALGGIVIGVGNWYVHGKNLQTKADAGAFGGGDSWEFPCGPQIDARIDAQARLYAGSNNPQVGGVSNSKIHPVLNGTDYYDDDSNPVPVENNLFPPNTSLCAAEKLDVKVTEDNSFPLASLIPLFPDIKRRARVEIQQIEGAFGLLPIAVRAPEPLSAAAVFYNEDPSATPTKRILGVKYFVKAPGISGMPGGLQGWSTYNTEDGAGGSNTWASFTPSATTGVAIAISFRGACATGLPAGNTKIITSPAPCFEDNYVGQSVSSLCNQGSNTQIVNCYYDTGNWPSENTVAGLQFIRGYPSGSVAGAGAPQLRTAYLDNGSCSTSTYFNAHPNNACTAILHATIDAGTDVIPPPPGPPGGTESRRAANMEVRYRIVSDTGNTCAFNTPACDLNGSGGPGNTSWLTTNTLPNFAANSHRNAIALRVRFTNPVRFGATNCNASGNNCEFFITANGTSVINGTAPTDAQVLAAPVQRMFRGNSLDSSSVQWLRLSADDSCNTGAPDVPYGEAASLPTGSNSCFFMDMGLKGGLALDAGEQPILLNDGIGSSQMGAVDCDPTIPQGQELTDGVVNGCNVLYAKHPFDWNPLCPSANSLFSGYPNGNPGSPWDDGRWPPIRCIKTRPTGSMNQLEKGLDERFFGNPNANSCPPMDTKYVKGRNYWDKDTNNGYVPPAGEQPLGYQELGASPPHNTHFDPSDPRIVTIFIAPTDAFAGNGQNTYPIAGFVEVYVTGYGRISGNGSLSVDDPCPGSAPPTDLDLSGGNSSGYAMWGHFLKYRVPTPNATPSGVLCDPASFEPCVATLVE